MFEPPSDLPTDTRAEPPASQPRPRGILVGYAVMAAVPLVLWGIANPLAAAVAVAALAGSYAAKDPALAAARCLARCRTITVGLDGWVEVRITRPRGCDCA